MSDEAFRTVVLMALVSIAVTLHFIAWHLAAIVRELQKVKW